MKFINHLKIGVFPSHVTNMFDEIKDMRGEPLYVYDGYIVKLLSQILKFSYTVLLNTAVGEPGPDGNWTGCIGMIQQGKADIAICGIAITEERCQVVNFSHPYLYTPVTFVTDKPQPLANSYAILYAFSSNVWLAFAISFVCMSLFIFVLFGKEQTYSTILIQMIGSLAEQSFKIKSRASHVRLTVIFWIIGAMCITYSYKAVLLASFSFPYFSGISDIKDLTEASQNPSFQCGIPRGSFIYKVLTQWNDERIPKCINRTPKLQKFDDFLKNSSYKKAMIGGQNYLSMFKEDFLLSEDTFFFAVAGVIVNKNFCCIQSLNDAIRRMHEAGLIQKYQKQRDFLNIITAKKSDNAINSSHRILKLSDLHGSLILLIFGLVLSTLVLIVEIIFYRFH